MCVYFRTKEVCMIGSMTEDRTVFESDTFRREVSHFSKKKWTRGTDVHCIVSPSSSMAEPP
jgi:hypothetical protein